MTASEVAQISSPPTPLLLIVEHCYSQTRFPFLLGPSALLADSFRKSVSVSLLVEALAIYKNVSQMEPPALASPGDLLSVDILAHSTRPQ